MVKKLEDHKGLQEVEEVNKNNIWNQVLGFIVGELFGGELLEKFTSHQHKGEPVAKNEQACDLDLHPFEKRIYDCVDLIHEFLRENEYKLPMGELNEKHRVAHALKNLFWGVIKLNHPELQKWDSKNETIGIRKGYKIVHFKESKPKNFMEFLESMSQEEDE